MQNQTRMGELHKPVLVDEVLEFLKVRELAHLNAKVKFIDATLGLGGHTIEILKNGGNVLGVDTDIETLEVARRVISDACPTLNRNMVQGYFKLIHGNFRNIDTIASKNRFSSISGILFDLGISSFQLDSNNRGFSFEYEETPLDMRVDKTGEGLTAADLLNVLRKDQLIMLFSEVMDFTDTKKLVEEICMARNIKKIETVGDFLAIINRQQIGKRKINPSTLPFLALRIAVNLELDNLKEALPKAFGLLSPGGRLVVISFHSGEDKIVKDFFRKKDNEKVGKIVTKEPIVPSNSEVADNPRSRSAKLRVLTRI